MNIIAIVDRRHRGLPRHGSRAKHQTAVAASITPIYYANCTEAREAGAAPIRRGEPGYRPPLDRDNDGIACEVR